MKKVIVVNILCSLLAVEIAGQLYARWTYGAFRPEHYRQELRNREALKTVFEPHPYLVARPRRDVRIEQDGAAISTTSIHTRVTGPDVREPGALRVAVVGGSTTFGTRLTDSDTWPWLLQARLGPEYEVINYGVPGYTTAEAIIQMSLIVPEAKPGIVIFYEGWNDLRSYHWPDFEADYSHHGRTQLSTLLPGTDEPTMRWTAAARYSFVLGLVSRLLGAPVGAAERPSDRNDPEVDRIYRRNLGTLRTLARQFGMIALFVPQVLNDENYSRPGQSRSWTPHIDDAAVPVLMRAFNGLMSAVCTSGDDQCQFVPEPLAERWDGNDFIDEGHLSRRGGEKLAEILATRVRRLGMTGGPEGPPLRR